MRKNLIYRLVSVAVVILLTVTLCLSAASAEAQTPRRTLPPLPTLPGRESSDTLPAAAPTEAPTPSPVPTEAPVKLETLSKDRPGGSDVNVLFIICYVLVFTIPLFITLRNMSKLRKLDRAERRRKKAGRQKGSEE